MFLKSWQRATSPMCKPPHRCPLSSLQMSRSLSESFPHGHRGPSSYNAAGFPKTVLNKNATPSAGNMSTGNSRISCHDGLSCIGAARDLTCLCPMSPSGFVRKVFARLRALNTSLVIRLPVLQSDFFSVPYTRKAKGKMCILNQGQETLVNVRTLAE